MRLLLDQLADPTKPLQRAPFDLTGLGTERKRSCGSVCLADTDDGRPRRRRTLTVIGHQEQVVVPAEATAGSSGTVDGA